MTTREIFGMDHEPQIDNRTPADVALQFGHPLTPRQLDGLPMHPSRAERDEWAAAAAAKAKAA